MTCTYTLGNGRKIEMNIWFHLLKQGGEVCYCESPKKANSLFEPKVKVLEDPESGEMFFEIDGELKSFMDYDALPLEVMIKRIRQTKGNNHGVHRDEFMATLLKEADDIGFVSLSDIPPFSSFPDDLFVPIEKEEKPKYNWEHKILLQHQSGVIAELYTSDLFRDLCNGRVKLVSRKAYKKRNPVIRTLAKIFEPSVC